MSDPFTGIGFPDNNLLLDPVLNDPSDTTSSIGNAAALIQQNETNLLGGDAASAASAVTGSNPSAVNPNNTQTTGTTGTTSALDVGSWLGTAGIIIASIVVIGVGLYMLASKD